MALTHAVGVDGAYTKSDNHGGNITQWSATFSMHLQEITGFASTSDREYRGGIRGGTFTASGNPTFGAANTSPGVTNAARRTGDTITLGVATGCTYAGNAIFQEIGVGSVKAGDATLNFGGTFSGPVTETWATS